MVASGRAERGGVPEGRGGLISLYHRLGSIKGTLNQGAIVPDPIAPKDAKDLTRSECALIAATLPNPRKFSSKSPSSYMLKRQSRILKEMKYVGEFPMK